MSSENLQLPQGFTTTGVTCGIKASGQPDLALFVSKVPSTSVGVFTQNRVVGAPVIVSRERLPSSTIRAIVMNSGNSNACTGERGLADARQMTSIVAEELKTSPEDVLVCSTGVIGHFLPMEIIANGIRSAAAELGNSSDSLHAAANAIRTTDTIEKVTSRRILIDGQTVTITGVAKGAAMIAPNMATMLSVIMTDCAIDSKQASVMLKRAVDQSFNCITVEGHTSTSDSVILLANGCAGVNCTDDDSAEAFQMALTGVCEELSQKIIRDAEGSRHFVRVEVSGLPVEEDARKIAKVVCESPLVKTAIAGNDPNWGRIVSAAGYAGVPFLERDVSLELNGVLIYDAGRPTAFDEAALSAAMGSGNVLIRLEFRLGSAAVTYWTCDLTAEYIRLNADYTT